MPKLPSFAPRQEIGFLDKMGRVIAAPAFIRWLDLSLRPSVDGVVGLSDEQQTQIDQNKVNIAANAAQIATNTSNISGNAAQIAVNAAAISTNASNIANNSSDIASNTSLISGNAVAISANTAAIAEIDTRVTALEESSRILHAESVVLEAYGDTVSVADKAKDLNKFGRNLVVGTSPETIGEFQGAVGNETFVTTNIIDSIVSSSASDTTQTIVIEGHTVDGSGNLTFVVQEAALNGQTEVTLGTPLARASSAYVKASGTFGTTPAALAGTVSIYDNTDGISGGVPVTAAATKLLISAGDTQSEKCATALSSTDYWFISHFSAGIGKAGGSASRVAVRAEVRDLPNGGAWLPIGREIILIPDVIGRTIQFDPFLIVPKNHDVRVVASTDSNTAEVFAELGGYLAGVQ